MTREQGSRTTGTISGDLEKARRENEVETNLRLARLGPISRFVFDLGRVGISVFQMGLISAIAYGIWHFLPIEMSPDWLGWALRGMLALAITGKFVIATENVFDQASSAWHDLWLPPRQ